jgi:hypothetical protein
MNLFKYLERKWRYYEKFAEEDEKVKFSRLYEIIGHLKCLRGGEGVRVRILHEIVVMRKVVTMKHVKLLKHICNLQSLSVESVDEEYTKYMQVEVLVSMYRILRRFIKILTFATKYENERVLTYSLHELRLFLEGLK